MTYIPSRDEVESALAKASSIDPLACEVRRLRQLDGEERAGETHEQLYQLQTKLARVEALPDKWKARIIGDDWTGAALQLEAALRDACDIKARDEHKEALRALNDALNDAARRLERAHDEADKYQVRALDAESEVRRLRDELEEERANSLAAGRYVRPALKDEP
jgi:hypothetical protein